MSKVAKKGGSAAAPMQQATSSLPKVNSPTKAANKSSTSNTKASNNAALPSIINKPQDAANSQEMVDTILTKAENHGEAVSTSILVESAANVVVLSGDTAASVPDTSESVVVTANDAVEAAPVPDTTTIPAAVITEQPPLPPLEDGQVTLLYEQYNEQFPIVASSITAAEIDEVYCLSFVMPGCRIRLSLLSPANKRKKEIELEEQGLGLIEREKQILLNEEPKGTFHGLRADGSYYVYAEQAAEQLALDQARAREIFAQQASIEQVQRKDDGRVLESCSCLYGNPCVDEYGCRDWGNRYAVAKQNGWKGF